MDQPSKLSLVAKYVAEDRLLLASVFAAILVAVTLSAGAPVYLRSLEQLAFETALRRLPEKAVQVHVLAPNTVLSHSALGGADDALAEALNGTIAGAYQGHAKYLRGARQLVGHPEHPIPDEGVADITVTRGFLQHLSGLESHVRVLEGRMATDLVARTPEGPELEAVVSEEVADGFEVHVGDVMRLRPSVEAQREVLARIVGVIEVGDPDSEYWRFASVYMETPVLELDLPSGYEVTLPDGVDIPEVHMLPMFVREWAMVEAVTAAYPGSLVKPNWFVLLDKERVARWPVAEAEQRMAGFRDAIIEAMPGSAVTASGAKNLIDELQRRSFLTQVPMLVLMVLTVITVLFFMVMMVSYIVGSRESDASLLRTRGAGILEVLRLYALEGAVMVAVAAVAGPFLALGAVALAGMLPNFGDITQGSLLTVRFDYWPFALAAGAAHCVPGDPGGAGHGGRTHGSACTQAALVPPADRAVLPQVPPGRGPAGAGRAGLLGAERAGQRRFRRPVRSGRDQRDAARRARAPAHRRGAAVHEALSAAHQVRQRRVARAGAPAGLRVRRGSGRRRCCPGHIRGRRRGLARALVSCRAGRPGVLGHTPR